MGARHYDPATGRFLQTDPLGIAADHLYAYGANNPYLHWDPTGFEPRSLMESRFGIEIDPLEIAVESPVLVALIAQNLTFAGLQSLISADDFLKRRHELILKSGDLLNSLAAKAQREGTLTPQLRAAMTRYGERLMLAETVTVRARQALGILDKPVGVMADKILKYVGVVGPTPKGFQVKFGPVLAGALVFEGTRSISRRSQDPNSLLYDYSQNVNRRVAPRLQRAPDESPWDYYQRVASEFGES